MASPRIPNRRGRRNRRRGHPLAAHPLLPLVFDGAWYLARYPDVLGAGLDPLDHLLGSGLSERRDPSPFVDTSYLAIQNPNLSGDGEALLTDLLERGLREGVPTSPYVDLPWYARRSGLAMDDPLAAFEHLVTVGRSKRRDPSPFVDLEWYSHHHPDIALSGVDPFEYFVSVGAWLGRFPHPIWDEAAYIAGNEYVRFAIGVGKYANGFEHFCATGHGEIARGAVALPVRVSDTLDEYAESRYLAANPAVARAVGEGDWPNGVTHLFAIGHRQVAAGRLKLKVAIPPATATLESGHVVPNGDWLVILVHFDVECIIDPHVLCAIEAYAAAGADVCVVTVDLDGEALEPLRERVTYIVQKSSNDEMRDFGGWHLALELLGDGVLRGYTQVVLTNDSAYFPVLDPSPFLAALTTSDADIFAATDSLSGGRYHLQSYFLALRPTALGAVREEIGRRIEEQVGATKLSLIQRFEVGLSEFALRKGLRTDVFYSIAGIQDVAAALSPPDIRPISHLAVSITNLTHHFWRFALRSGLPFLKVELLRDNPVAVDIDGWETMVDGPCGADLIADHLARVRAKVDR